ncbi:hypothetical protein Pcinc_029938 [Petrolisthes cinctipes]|uniref:Uncharacterized protein n=1 Tax=Petrolisthes cinctipes TaxID=88211 RepID=A0AAE1EZC8_PETCI|nr:hypothetical protein Pcinc_029938 [Petrolisthes cinctipes]
MGRSPRCLGRNDMTGAAVDLIPYSLPHPSSPLFSPLFISHGLSPCPVCLSLSSQFSFRPAYTSLSPLSLLPTSLSPLSLLLSIIFPSCLSYLPVSSFSPAYLPASSFSPLNSLSVLPTSLPPLSLLSILFPSSLPHCLLFLSSSQFSFRPAYLPACLLFLSCLPTCLLFLSSSQFSFRPAYFPVSSFSPLNSVSVLPTRLSPLSLLSNLFPSYLFPCLLFLSSQFSFRPAYMSVSSFSPPLNSLSVLSILPACLLFLLLSYLAAFL